MSTNLEFIKSVTPDGSSSSILITDVFSAKYDVYQVNYSIVTDSTSPKNVDLRLINSSNAVISNSNYDYVFHLLYTASASVLYKNTGQTKWTEILGYTDYPPEGNAGTFQIYNPFSSSTYSYIAGQYFSRWNGGSAGGKNIGVLKETTSCTGLNIFLSSTNPTSASNISVYGVK